MSEKLSELEKYVCDLCATTQCLAPTRKTLSKEGKNQEGDLIILDFDIYHCCRDNNASSYCAYCEKISTKKIIQEEIEKKHVPSAKAEVVKESTVIKKVVDEVKELPKKAVSELQSQADALLAKIKKLKEEKAKLDE